MKNYILLLTLIIFSCSKENDPKPSGPKTDPELQIYYDKFVSAATSYGVTIKTPVVIQFGACDCEKAGVWYVYQNDYTEFSVYHALGHAVLGRSETSEASVMNMTYASEYSGKEQVFLNELFAN